MGWWDGVWWDGGGMVSVKRGYYCFLNVFGGSPFLKKPLFAG